MYGLRDSAKTKKPQRVLAHAQNWSEACGLNPTVNMDLSVERSDSARQCE